MNHLLLTNDDGIRSPGLHALAEEFNKSNHVIVMAPTSNRSGASHSITLDRPVTVRHDSYGYSVEGTPCDCVHIALNGGLSEKLKKRVAGDNKEFQGVLSGINLGANLGEDVHYSGTVGAAREANLFGVNSMAVSLVIKPDDTQHFWTSAAVYTKLIWSHFDDNLRKTPWFLNINVPNLPIASIKGVMLTRLSTRKPSLGLVPTTSPRGDEAFWIGQFGHPVDDHTDGLLRDHIAVSNGWVSITPLTRSSAHPNIQSFSNHIEEVNRLIYTGASL